MGRRFTGIPSSFGNCEHDIALQRYSGYYKEFVWEYTIVQNSSK